MHAYLQVCSKVTASLRHVSQGAKIRTRRETGGGSLALSRDAVPLGASDGFTTPQPLASKTGFGMCVRLMSWPCIMPLLSCLFSPTCRVRDRVVGVGKHGRE